MLSQLYSYCKYSVYCISIYHLYLLHYHRTNIIHQSGGACILNFLQFVVINFTPQNMIHLYSPQYRNRLFWSLLSRSYSTLKHPLSFEIAPPINRAASYRRNLHQAAGDGQYYARIITTGRNNNTVPPPLV